MSGISIKTIIVIVALVLNFGFMGWLKHEVNVKDQKIQELTLKLSKQEAIVSQQSDSIQQLKDAAAARARSQKTIQEQAKIIAKTYEQKAKVIMNTKPKSDDYCKEANDLINNFIDDRDNK